MGTVYVAKSRKLYELIYFYTNIYTRQLCDRVWLYGNFSMAKQPERIEGGYVNNFLLVCIYSETFV